jgi:hypothetical protein
MDENDAAWGDLIQDAEYVLGELARGEIPCMADLGVVMASDKLLDAVNLARANPTSREAVGESRKDACRHNGAVVADHGEDPARYRWLAGCGA